jgi:hypothetical protein
VHDDGELTLTADGEVRWHHPGYYDDYRVTAGASRDPETAALARAIFQAGTRERHHDGKVIRVEVRALPGRTPAPGQPDLAPAPESGHEARKPLAAQ